MKGKISAWEKVEIARSSQRKTALDYIEQIFDEFIELHGDRYYKDDEAIVGGLGRIGNKNYTIIAQQKGRNTKENIQRNFGMPNPESYRKAIRLMKQAEKFHRPIITFIDTKGAYPGIGAEERGQGEAIAKSMFEMSGLKVPIIAIVIGEGSSGGALAICIANKIIMLENAVFSILSPEGYASILWKDSSRAKEAAEKMKLTAKDLYDFKIVDKMIKEKVSKESEKEEVSKEPDKEKEESLNKNDEANCWNQEEFEQVAKVIQKEIIANTKELEKLTVEEMIEQRYQKFRNIGDYQEVKK